MTWHYERTGVSCSWCGEYKPRLPDEGTPAGWITLGANVHACSRQCADRWNASRNRPRVEAKA